MKLSRAACELLLHRLDVDDAIADALELDSDSYEFKDAVRDVRQALSAGRVDLVALSPLARRVLTDCADGSTYFADAEDAVATGEMSRGHLLSQHKAAHEVERLLGVSVPRS